MTPAQVLKQNYIATMIEFKWWNKNRTIDKTNKNKMAESVQAQAKSIRASKDIYNTDIPCIAKINAFKTAVIDWWKSRTHAYGSDGVRLLRKVDLEAFQQQMAQAQKDLDPLAQDIDNHRFDIIDDARSRLGDTLSIGDYPLDLSTCYGITVSYPNLTPSQELPPEVYQQQKAYLEAKINEAAEAAQQAFTQDFFDMVSHLAERLTPDQEGKPKAFSKTAVEKLQDFIAAFQNMKLKDGDDFDNLVNKTKELIAGVTAKDIRNAPALKKELKTALDEIEKQLSAMVTNAPRRKIIRPSTQKEASVETIQAAPAA